VALEEQVLLSIDDALNSVGQLETALTSAASLFASSLTEALSVLDSLQVGTVDATEVTTAIDAAVTGADLAPVVTADASSVTADIDSAVAAVDAQVTPSTDAGSITADIDAAVQAADATVPINVDASAVAGEIDAAVAGADSTVTIGADTSQATDAVNQLGSAASSSAGGVEQLRGVAEGLGTAAALGKGEVGALGEAAGGLGVGAGVAAGGIAALTGFTAELFHAAAEGQVAENKFASSLGDVAESVKHVNIGGLNEDLVGLATRTGNAKDQLLLADAKIGDLGHSAGATDPQIAALAEQINVVAIRATTMNPNLGEAGDVADRLAGAFARGGRALIPFGIALTSSEINARALRDTGKSTATELTLFEKAAAGAAITTERLGSHLGTDINQGAKSAEVQIRSLKQEFHLALEELGKPLLDPLVRALREGQPLLIQIGTDLGHLAEAVLPLFQKGIEAIAPLVGGASVAFGLLLDVVKPIVDVLLAIPTPVFTAVAAFFALSPVIEGAVAGFVALRAVMIGVKEVGIASVGESLITAINPVSILALGLAGLVTVFLSQAASARKAKEDNQSYADALGNVNKSVDATIFERVNKAFRDQATAVTAAGSSVEQLTHQVTSGKAGYSEFLAQLERSGTITASARAALESTSTPIAKLILQGGQLATGNQNLNHSTVALIDAFQRQQVSAEKAAKTEVEQFAAQNAGNRAAVEGATARNKLKDGTTDYLGVLRQVKPATDAEAGAQKGAAGAAADHAAAIKKLDDQLNALLQDELGAVSSSIKLERAQLGVQSAAEALTAAQKDATDAVNAHGKASEEAKVSSEKLHSAELDVRQSALDLAAAHIDAEQKVRQLTGASLSAADQQAITAQAFRQTAQTVGADSPLGQRLLQTANQLDTLHGPPPIEVDVNTALAEGRLRDLQARLNSLNQASFDAGRLASGGQLRMAGGPVAAGDSYVVGEREAEVFVPSVSGTIFNQAQLRQIVASAANLGIEARSPTTSAAPVTQNVNVYEVAADPRATAFAVSSRIGQAARR